MSENHLRLAALLSAAGLEEEADLEARVKRAMRQALDVWFEVDEPTRMKAAIVAALSKTPDEAEKRRIEGSWKMLLSLNAAVSGVPVDFEESRRQAGDGALPLLGWWHAVKEAEATREKF